MAAVRLDAQADGPCAIQRLRLFNFRNYAEQVLELGPGLNLVAGRNAQGKTNLLEAIATLLLTRSPRAPTSADVLRWGADETLVDALVLRPAADRTLTVRFRRDASTGRISRTTAVDGSARPARELLGLCPVVLFWPDDLQLVKGGPDGRRRLLDILLAQIDARSAVDLLRCRHVVEQRNAVLRHLRAGASTAEELESFTAQLVDCGARLQVARAALVEGLAAPAAEALSRISGGRERLGLRYRPDGTREAEHDLTAAREVLAANLRRRRDEEVQRGLTLAGPHRDELELLLGDRPARSAASQGQQRSIVLALKLAEVSHIVARLAVLPVMLLDDVLSELDPARRRDLCDGLAAAGLQALITSSDWSADALPAGTRRFQVDAGHVRSITVS